MTTHNNFHTANRGMQDGNERHIFGKLKYLDSSGAVVTVNGTGTQDNEAVVLNTGYGFNLEDDENAEVVLLALGSDPNQKFAMMSIPRNKQRKWGKGIGGVQNPLDPEKALEFNGKRTWATEPNFAIGEGLFEVVNGEVLFRVKVRFANDIEVGGKVQAGGSVSTAGSFIGPDPSGSGEPPPAIPGFEK